MSGVPEFYIFFHFTLVVYARSFADDNTLLSFAKTIENPVSVLESEKWDIINWFKDTHKIWNLGKFQAIIFHKQKGNYTNQIINIDQKEIKTLSKVKPLGIEVDDKLNFNQNSNNICKSNSTS